MHSERKAEFTMKDAAVKLQSEWERCHNPPGGNLSSELQRKAVWPS